VTPDHLTWVGLLGAAIGALGFGACHLSNSFLVVATLGLFLNWFGDSLDGTLARSRKIERPHFGYFFDHSVDLIAQTFLILGLGLSPYFTLPSALFALSMYLLMSSYTYLKVMILKTHNLSYGGMGATELRIMMACWGLFAAWIGPGLTSSRLFGYPAIDVVIGTLWLATFLAFIWTVRQDLAQFNEHGLDPATPEHPRAQRANAEAAIDLGREELLRDAAAGPVLVKTHWMGS
jgi:phosphatidylglycerophosphate synthase